MEFDKLTPTLAEVRFYDLGFSSAYRGKFYLPKLFKSKLSYPFSRLLQLLYFSDFARKIGFLIGRFGNFAKKSNSSDCKTL